MDLQNNRSSLTSDVVSEEDSGLDIGGMMDDSLTDIQWLQKMDGSKSEVGVHI